MRPGYYRKLSDTALAVLDLCDYYGTGLIITRISVPSACRGHGYASALLDECCSDADLDRIDLYLEISPSDGLDYYELEAWYGRRGFVNLGGMYRRRCQSNSSPRTASQPQRDGPPVQ